MAKAKMKQVIPKFSNEAEEAVWWEAHRAEVETEIRRRMKQRQSITLSTLVGRTKPSQPVTLRIAKEDLETARRLAARQGLGYQTYIKMLLRGALAKQAGEEPATGFSTTGKKPARANGRRPTKRTSGRGR